MPYKIVLSARAKRQVAKISAWYETEKRGLGIEFVQTLDRQFADLVQTPSIFTKIRPQIRRAVLTRFPYSVFFTERDERIVVIAVIHHARNPERWPRY